MRTIGLTGGIATGKSTVAELLAQRGAVVIDADQLSRDAVAPGTPLLQRIAALFGADALQADGSLDRQAVRELIFRDPERRKQLEALLHPAIRELSLRRLEEARQSGAAVAVYMAPLLIEAGAADRVDEIWVVTVRPEVQLERLMTRDGCDRQQAERIVAAQMPLAEKEKYGVVVIDNSGSPEETARQVEEAWQRRIGP
ncbi:dephospho-CoA kinase [Trichlorobacter ammonificans]|uniref:Dephospho-CoA kinase n=1 Tax=Trichlorobacter ammonificans TaxID=2916410 RepID=A0ABM9DC55_9BACT|nr:dephospho-CoA kinase [Trichlorobacter ammonificans]CAH2032000.1 Dephospho-CoA kinase [Trichlorobacter ammonificans]